MPALKLVRPDQADYRAAISTLKGVLRGGECRQHLVVEEVGERPVADVVQEAGDPQRLHDQPLGWEGFVGRKGGKRRSKRDPPARPLPDGTREPCRKNNLRRTTGSGRGIEGKRNW